MTLQADTRVRAPHGDQHYAVHAVHHVAWHHMPLTGVRSCLQGAGRLKRLLTDMELYFILVCREIGSSLALCEQLLTIYGVFQLVAMQTLLHA